MFLLSHGKFVTGSSQVWVGDGNNNPINLIQDFEGGSNMIAKLVGSQTTNIMPVAETGPYSIIPVVNDFDYLELVGFYIMSNTGIAPYSIKIFNGFNGNYIFRNLNSIVQIQNVSSEHILFANDYNSGMPDSNLLLNYYKYV